MAKRNNEAKSKNVMALDLGTAFRKLFKALGRALGRLVSGAVVTLDISQTGIRIMETRGRVVRRWADVSFTPEELKSIAPDSGQALGTMVKQLMDSSGIKAKSIIASISGLYTVSRVIPLPNLPPAPTLEESVDEIAQEIMPVPTDNLYFFWQTVSTNEGEQQVFAIGVPRDIMDDKIRALKIVGINPRVIEIKAMSLVRVVNQEQALILNIDPSNFDIIMVVKGVPEIMHSLAWRRDSMSIEDAAEYLATNLEVTVDFYNAHHVDAPFEMTNPLYITGQMSIELELMAKLRARLGFNIEQLTPSLECPDLLPVSQYAVNIGLAMRQEVSQRDGDGGAGLLPLDLNLLPRAYRPWRPTTNQVYSAIILMAAVALIFPLLEVTTEAMGKTAVLQQQSDILNNQLVLKKMEIERREPLQKSIGEYNSIVTRDSSFSEDVSVIIEEAERADVVVNSIAHDEVQIAINCRAEDYLSFRAYLAALEESGRFASPIPPPEGYPYTTSGTITLKTRGQP
ncbi:MAG TPA: pilus assembly protein PilM [Dehalococcoidia bacterium]|nr:pilus assembly protein PilM [Dehalococcoidia bacterium]